MLRGCLQLKPRWGRSLVIVSGVVTVTGLVWLWWKGVPRLYEGSGAGPDVLIQSTTGIRMGLIIGLAGAGVISALWVNTRALSAIQMGQTTDRFAKAVEQLGSETIDVRLGGIYALEQLAVDSHRGQDQVAVVEVLGAFTRVHSDPLYQWQRSQKSWRELCRSPDELPAEAKAYVERQIKPPADVQAAITVLGRLADRVTSRADLSGAYLCGAALTRAKFARAIFTGAGLADADLTNAELTGAVLADTDLTHALFAGADLAGADLAGADLTGADLTSANLTGASLPAVTLIAVILINVVLVGAELTRADLSKAYLNDADLTGADLSGADLTGADLTGAKLNRAKLTGAYLIEAVLRGADLTGADLGGADLGGADLADAATLTQHQLNRAQGSARTIIPEGLIRPAHWS
jgi:uncharacterized protein YjbI with pentapeptide repeats